MDIWHTLWIAGLEIDSDNELPSDVSDVRMTNWRCTPGTRNATAAQIAARLEAAWNTHGSFKHDAHTLEVSPYEIVLDAVTWWDDLDYCTMRIEVTLDSRTLPAVTEGTIPYAGGETWYRIVGDGEEPGKLPLLCLHGGPGAPHDYLEALDELAATGRRVAFYDQIGCGRSWVEKPADLWTVELFVAEVQVIRDALGLDRVHLFGSSWGGMLGMEYALTKPAGLAGLVLSSSPASIPLWEAETGRLRRDLPAETQRVLEEHEAAGTLDSPEYEAATMEFYKRHVCRVDPFPDFVQRTFDGLAEHPDVYLTMQGPNEFVITGTLRTWDITDRLGEIAVPTLITAGAHDEFTPPQAQRLSEGIPGSELVTFENSSHMQFVEEPERYRDLVAAFLDRVEQG
jgi:proline-specific peptidase